MHRILTSPAVFALGLAVLFGAVCGYREMAGPRTLDEPVPHASHKAGHHAGAAAVPANREGAPTSINQTPPPGPAPEGMVWVPGGTFWMGCDDCDMPDALPVHRVSIDGFWMDATPVTNAQFQKFVDATGYQTIAEHAPDRGDFPGVPREQLVPGSAVFTPPASEVSLNNYQNWWSYVPGANWKRPEGPRSDLRGREDHPVVQIAWKDAVVYAKWAGKRLPTEAEFEFAARGGLDRNRYAWGNDLKPGGKWAANIWQGSFPWKNAGEDGFERTSPVRAFPANRFGLYDMGGNVWHWCADWYQPGYFAQLANQGIARNPQGPPDSFDAQEPGIPKRVQKGGSFLCSDRYCSRYLVGSRGKGAADTGGSNTGFRCVRPAS